MKNIEGSQHYRDELAKDLKRMRKQEKPEKGGNKRITKILENEGGKLKYGVARADVLENRKDQLETKKKDFLARLSDAGKEALEKNFDKFKIYNLAIKGGKKFSDYQKALEEKGIKIDKDRIHDDRIKSFFNQLPFAEYGFGMNTLSITPEDMGFPKGQRIGYGMVTERAIEFGLELVPPDACFVLPLEYPELREKKAKSHPTLLMGMNINGKTLELGSMNNKEEIEIWETSADGYVDPKAPFLFRLGSYHTSIKLS